MAGAAPASAAAAQPQPGGAAAAPATTDPRVAALAKAGTKPLRGPAADSYMNSVEQALRSQLGSSGVAIARSGNQIVIDVPADMAFATGKSSLIAASRSTLVSIGAVLKRFGQTVIDVYGYTDSQGPPAAQLDLSQRRAVTVATILATQGVGQERFYIEGKGAANPIRSNATPEGREHNRRIDIQISPVS
jgi:outer membrane protein OmpA-like peptidoglycan-associated protein